MLSTLCFEVKATSLGLCTVSYACQVPEKKVVGVNALGLAQLIPCGISCNHVIADYDKMLMK